MYIHTHTYTSRFHYASTMRENYCVAFLATDFVSLAPRWIYITRYTGHLNIRTLEVSAHITFLPFLSLSLFVETASIRKRCLSTATYCFVRGSFIGGSFICVISERERERGYRLLGAFDNFFPRKSLDRASREYLQASSIETTLQTPRRFSSSSDLKENPGRGVSWKPANSSGSSREYIVRKILKD